MDAATRTVGPCNERWVLDEAPSALIVLAPQGQVRHWNAPAERTFGYPADEALGQPLAALVMPAERQAEEYALRLEADRADVARRDMLCQHRDGRLMYVDLQMRAVRNAVDRPDGYVLCAVDVTAQKARRDAQRLGERFHDLLESVPDAIVLANESGHVVLVNEQAEQMFGWPRGEMTGMGVERLLPERYRQAHVRHRMRFQRAPQVRRMGEGLELHGLNRDGREFPVEVSLSPLDTAEGHFVMSAIRDISERKRAELALQQTNAALRDASLAKDRFLATMSHELRTPLNAILGFTGLLLMGRPGTLTPEQSRQLQLVQRSGEHLLALINDLLDMAKMQAGMRELVLEPVDLPEVMREVHATLMPLASARALDLLLVLPPGPVVWTTDRRAFRQILLNLAQNALKFTRAGEVRLVLETAEDGTPRLAVHDTGQGIAQADLPKLFQPFTQVGDPRHRPDGTGMGLHLSARLAELAGGRIDVQSRPGEGSTFTLRFHPAARLPPRG